MCPRTLQRLANQSVSDASFLPLRSAVLLLLGVGKPHFDSGMLLQNQLPKVNLVIIESVRIAVISAESRQLLKALIAWAGPTAVEAGCLSCRILQESSAPQAFCYQAHWNTRDDLIRHLRTKHYKKLLVLMELGITRPLVEFHTVTETQGFDLVERAREV